MSHHTSPQSPTRTRLRARPGVVGTPGSSGLPASLLRFVQHDSPASVHNDADSFEPKGGWDVVRLALGLRDSGPPPGGVFTSARSSPQCSTASCDAGNDEDEDEDEDDEDKGNSEDETSRHGGARFDEHDVCFRLDRSVLRALNARLCGVEVDVDAVARRLTRIERWRDAIEEDLDVSVDVQDDEHTVEVGAETQVTPTAPTKTKTKLEFAAFATSPATAASAAVAAKKTATSLRVTTAGIEGIAYGQLSPTFSQSDPDGSRRARAVRLLHPSPPDSPNSPDSENENDISTFFLSVVERYNANGSASFFESVDPGEFETVLHPDDNSPVRSTVFSESVKSTASGGDGCDARLGASHTTDTWQRMIRDIREVRECVAMLKQQEFFAATTSA